MPAVADLIHQQTTTTGTGNLTLTAVNGKQTFNTAFGTGGTDVFWYFISNNSAAEYEWGTGHLSASNTLVRDTVVGGSNGTSPVSFSVGVKDVSNDVPAVFQARIVHVSATVPATPVNGQFWFDLTVGALYLYVNDGNSSQWVEAGPAALPYAASDTVAGAIEIAVQSEMETATDVVRAVTPGRQQFHPSATKVWGFTTYSGGTPTLQTSFNVTSITDTGVGQLTVTIDTDFSSANYAVQVETQNVTSNDKTTGYGSLTAGSFQCTHFTSAGTLVDPASFSFCAHGDQ